MDKWGLSVRRLVAGTGRLPACRFTFVFYANVMGVDKRPLGAVAV